MKHLSFLLFAVVAFALKVGAQATSNCLPSPALQKLYRVDVADIALQRIYELKSPDTILIEIPQRYQDTVMGALAAVCNLDTVYEADSVFLHYCVHRYRKFMQKIEVKVDPNISWVNNWRALNIKTGDSALDNFLLRYGVYLSSYWYDPRNSEPTRDWAYLSSDRHINWKVLGDSLMLFPGIWGYSKDYQIGDGDRIDYWKDSVMHLTFTAGRGDCPVGCTEFKKWTYSITDDCSVKIDAIVDGIYADRYMPHCNLTPLSIGSNQIRPQTSVQLYPNPVQTTLYLSNSGNGLIRFSVYNVTGKKMLAGNYDVAGIDVSGLPGGFYVLSVQDNNHYYSAVRNFIKQ